MTLILANDAIREVFVRSVNPRILRVESALGCELGKRSENTDFRHESGPKNYTNFARRILGFTSREPLVREYHAIISLAERDVNTCLVM